LEEVRGRPLWDFVLVPEEIELRRIDGYEKIVDVIAREEDAAA
jgi:hypothetical protein